MSVFQRMFKVGEAKVNQIVDKMEKPEVMLDQAIRDKHKQISEAKKSVMSVIATERQTKAQLDKDRNEQANWEAKAEQALKAGREDLAVKALERATEHQQKADGLQDIWQSQRDNVDQLKQEITKMEDELAEFKRNKDFIIAQAKTAEVKKQIYEAKANIKNPYGDWTVIAFSEDENTYSPHLALVSNVEQEDQVQPLLVRIHSECMTGDIFGSLRCDCGEQLAYALEHIGNMGGILIYLRQE